MVETIDWEQFDAVMGDGSDGMAELFGEFVLDIREKLDRLVINAQEGNAAAIAWDSHQMKGSAGSFGMIGFIAEVVAVETQAKSGDTSYALAAVPRLKQVFEAGVATLREKRPFLS